MKSLITGITGFVGSHLAEFLISRGDTIAGIYRWRSPMDNIEDSPQISEAIKSGKVKLFIADLNDLHSLQTVIEETKPDRIFHLAAQSYVPSSYKAPADTLQTNVVGTCNLLEAVKSSGKLKSGKYPVVHICSSSEVYGNPLKDEIPIKETNPLRPLSPYAVSKVGEDRLGYMYWKAYNIPVVITRAFTHGGPRRGYVFFESAFARQIALIEKGKQEPVLKVGNLDSVRTYMDVRDTVKGYVLLSEKGIPGEVYNIGGNVTQKVGDYLKILLGYSKKKIKVVVDPALYRPADATLQIPDLSKIHALGWKAKITPEQSLLDLLNYWRERV
jgi:GDP-mannose 4,6-dehydratase